jgi:hypothetical protein
LGIRQRLKDDLCFVVDGLLQKRQSSSGFSTYFNAGDAEFLGKLPDLL